MLVLLSMFGDLAEVLAKNWYSKNLFVLWGGRNLSFGIPMSKTTMTVEAHWSALKKIFLLGLNRPRSDMLVYIIDKKVVKNS